MKRQSELLGRLHKLKPQDRAWIVNQLSERERAQLLSTVAGPTASIADMQLNTVEERASQADVGKSLAKVEPRRVAAVLKSEPAWLIAVIVSVQQPAWSKVLLEALPAVQRADIERIQLQHAHFGTALIESATRLTLTRCHDSDIPVESPFERLVERLSTARARKRLTLHL